MLHGDDIPEEGQEISEELGDQIQKSDAALELPVEGYNNVLEAMVIPRAGSSVSSKNLSPEELTDRREERKLKLELPELNSEQENKLAKLTFEKEQALEEKRMAQEERRLTQ
ncbi:hypothetical protein NDU88_002341 [Pleurodeles waltl]|uniref:Stathmin n=1 Tax=Pleurodeles waltl TaxID=8319 RepID=A0AAV7VAA1_PLEWA|nr:hypothetical protein NDU88_002341 [Pleurodeles waltl]